MLEKFVSMQALFLVRGRRLHPLLALSRSRAAVALTVLLQFAAYFEQSDLFRRTQGKPGQNAVPEDVGSALPSTRSDEHGLVQLYPGVSA